MPYRGPEGFSWRGSDISTRRRAMAAVVLLGAGWAVGFFAGRMSAWLFPVVETNIAAVMTVTPARYNSAPAAQPPASAPAVQSAAASRSNPDEKVASPPASPSTPPEKTPGSTATGQGPALAPDKAEADPPQRVAKADPSGMATKDDTREQDASRSPERGVVLVNPEWKQAPASQPDREPEPERRAYRPEADTRQGRLADESALAKCESRYSSFRRDDGTYQPYGRSTREPCPFLSDRPRRSRY